MWQNLFLLRVNERDFQATFGMIELCTFEFVPTNLSVFVISKIGQSAKENLASSDERVNVFGRKILIENWHAKYA